MSTDTGEREYANHELLDMDKSEAERRLTKLQYDRWEKLTDLHEQADEQREEWANEEQQVADITVSTDMEQLGTRVDVYGNDLLVHIASDDRELRQTASELEALQDKYADADAEELTELPEDDQSEMHDHLRSMLSHVIVEWDGVRWSNLGEDQQADILAEATESWGLDGLLLAWVEIANAVEQDREEKLDVVENFR